MFVGDARNHPLDTRSEARFVGGASSTLMSVSAMPCSMSRTNMSIAISGPSSCAPGPGSGNGSGTSL